jgi:hypothetical protein
MSGLHPSDKRSAMTGLVITAVSLFIICFTIVQLTNMKFANAEHATPAAERK